MGFSCSFIAVKGRDKAEVAIALGLEDTGKVEGEPYRDRALSLAALPTDWILLWSGDYDYVTPQRLAAVSTGAEALGWRVIDTVMASEAWGYRDGQEVWSILYDCGKEPPLATSGDLPPPFVEARDRLFADQARSDAQNEQVDYVYDLPAEVAYALTGFRHDEDSSLELTYTVLAKGAGADRVEGRTAKSGFFAALFGKR